MKKQETEIPKIKSEPGTSEEQVKNSQEELDKHDFEEKSEVDGNATNRCEKLDEDEIRKENDVEEMTQLEEMNRNVQNDM